MRFLFLTAGLACLSGCASSPTEPVATAPVVTKSVLDADATMVADCQFLDTFTETQYSGMLFAGSGLKAAQAKVRNRISAIGGTHVVWGSMNAGGAIQAATGTGYRC